MIDTLARHWFAVLLLLAYTAVLAWNARAGGSTGRSLAHYYVGGRNIGGWVLGVSFFATYASTNSYIGNAGKAYQFGVAWLLLVVFMVVCALLSWRLVAPRLMRCTRDWDVVTLPEFIGRRYDSLLARRVCAGLIVFASVFYMTAVYKGAGHLFQTFLDLPYEAAVGLVLVIVVLYTSVGGFVSVVRTDVVQGLLMLVGALLVGGVTLSAAGGAGVFAELAAAPDTAHLFAWDAAMPFPVLLGILLVAAMKLLVEPRQISRFFALRDVRAARTGMWVSVVGIVVIFGALLPVGLLAHRLLPESVSDTDLIVPLLVNGPLFAGPLADLLVLSMLAAAMSSLDSVLLTTASVARRDLVVPRMSDGEQIRHTRVLVVLLAIVPALVALDPPGGIVELTIFSGSLYAGCFLPALMLGLWTTRGDGVAAVASFVVGAAVVGIWPLTPGGGVLHEVFPALAASLAVFLALGWRRRLPGVVLQSSGS